jgi:hypothetical protein
MFGGGRQRKGTHVRHYVCSRQCDEHDCEQDHARLQLPESTITEDIRRMSRDEQSMGRILAEVNRLLDAERANPDKEILKVDAQIA